MAGAWGIEPKEGLGETWLDLGTWDLGLGRKESGERKIQRRSGRTHMPYAGCNAYMPTSSFVKTDLR